MEATDPPISVLNFYDELLRANPANAVRIFPLAPLCPQLDRHTHRPSGSDEYPFSSVLEI